MNLPDPMVPINDPAQPRPVRVAAWLGLLAHALLGVAALLWALDTRLVVAIVGVIGVAQLGGWLLVVERSVTPTASPRDDRGVRLIPADRP